MHVWVLYWYVCIEFCRLDSCIEYLRIVIRCPQVQQQYIGQPMHRHADDMAAVHLILLALRCGAASFLISSIFFRIPTAWQCNIDYHSSFSSIIYHVQPSFSLFNHHMILLNFKTFDIYLFRQFEIVIVSKLCNLDTLTFFIAFAICETTFLSLTRRYCWLFHFVLRFWLSWQCEILKCSNA